MKTDYEIGRVLGGMRRISTVLIAVLMAGAAVAQRIVCPPDASPRAVLAAKEVRRYIFLRTGALPTIVSDESDRSGGNITLMLEPALGAQGYRLAADGGSTMIAGGSDLGLLYGAYRYAELLGVRFYLHGDVVPDDRLDRLPKVKEEIGKPLFGLRGVNPWGWHPEGIDAWSTDDYKAVFAQLTKMRMNFIGIHCYPEGHPFAEPTVWLGLDGDFDAEGRVTHSYPSRYFNTLFKGQGWGAYLQLKTSTFRFGGALLFDDEAWAPDVLRGYAPVPVTAEACNDVFNRMGAQFSDAFTFARRLGVKTCLGTEAPLTIPSAVRERLKGQGVNPADSAAVRAVYEGTFKRIMACHPLDYYWIWTPESWTWRGNSPAQYANTVADIKLAIAAAKAVHAPFQITTAGWVLGPGGGIRGGDGGQDRAAFDKDLPKEVPVSAISRETGARPVDPAFARIAGREKWAIPWLESDNRQGLAAIQLEAGRMRRDAADALAYGCTGLMGLHWRTAILAPNISALAQAAWNQDWDGPAATWSVQGKTANYPAAAVAGTSDDPLYRSCRYDLGAVTVPAKAGTYKVTLKFCEPYFDAADERICDVKVQGNTVLTNLDIFAKVGKFKALDYTFDDIAVSDGTLTIELIARKSLPCVSAVAVEGADHVRKINLGGAAYKDWSADIGKPRSLPVDDFYADWARANFGLAEAGKIFAAIDGKVPQVTDGGCPTGKLTPVRTPWEKVAPGFAFVCDFERLRPRIHGAGNLERFDYWLNNFSYIRSLAELRCALARPNSAEVTRLYADAYRYLLATVNTPGGLAMVVNMENHAGWGPAVAKHASQPWPSEYQGEPRLIVPTVRSAVDKGESLKVKIIALAGNPVDDVRVHLRTLGHGEWRTIPAKHIARGVYEAVLQAMQEDVEYYISSGRGLVWPATAPRLNQTIVVME